MNFTTSDVARLYGTRLFRIPPLPHPARLTLLLRTGDLAAPALRELLSKIVQAVGLELSDCTTVELDAAPLTTPAGSKATLSFGWLVPSAIELPSLSALATDTALKRASWERLKPLKGTL
jgi:hypothetical protein